MPTSEHRSFQVDLDAWKPDRHIEVTVGPGTRVGHLVDELTQFLALPRRTEEGVHVGYVLTGNAEDETMRLAPDARLVEIDEGVVALALGAGEKLSAVRQRIEEIESEIESGIRKAVEEEIDYWIEQGRTLVAGAFAGARDEVRERIRRRIDEFAHDGKLTLGTQFRTHRALRRLLPFDAGVGYQDAMRTGLDHGARIGGGAPAVVSRSAAALGWFGLGGIGAAVGTALAVTAALAFVIAFILDGGTRGEDGKDGTTWLTGQGAPPPDEGAADDFYFDQVDSAVWRRAGDGEGWIELIDLKGRDGASWSSDQGPPPDDLGTVGDFYLDERTGAIWTREGSSSQAESGWVERTNIRGRDGRSWRAGDSAPGAEAGLEAEFYLDRCEGVVYTRTDDDDWTPVIDIAGTQGPGPPEGCTNAVANGDSLWAVVKEHCGTTTNADTARAVSETWLASLDVIGGDPNQIDAGQPLLIRCS